MVYSIPSPIAIPLQHVAEFTVPDPWNGDVAARWTLRVYRMTGENNRALYTKYSADKQNESATGRGLDRDDVLGLHSSVDGLFHILPIALVRLWQQGRVPNEALPALIAQVYGTLERRDFYDPALAQSWRRYLVYGIFAAGTLFLLLGVYRAIVLRDAPYGGGSTALIFWGVLGLLYWLIAGVLLAWMRRREARVTALEQRLAAALPVRPQVSA